MRIGIAHRDRLVREAIRRALVSSGRQALWAAADRAELARGMRREPAELLLIEADWFVRSSLDALAVRCGCLVLAPNDQSPGVYEALISGALGQVPAPWLEADGELMGASRMLARIDRCAGLVAPVPISEPEPKPAPTPATGGRGSVRVLALGASTGGPNALATILNGLPPDLPAAVLIVQHIDPQFVDGLVDWLQSQCALPVALAVPGEFVAAGRVYVGDHRGHLVYTPGGQLGYAPARSSDLHAPSVDRLFESLVGHTAGVAALLTGMGDDGARGLLALRKVGWHTVAQDEQSSPVYGMPRAAVECGAAVVSLPLAAIAKELVRQLSGSAVPPGRDIRLG